MTLQERFNKFIEKTEECWLWTSATQGTYGAFWYDSKQILAHRMSYILHHGPITDGLIVRHKCRNKLCVKPEHLETGTLKENSADRWRDNTMNNKLTVEQVQLIRSSDKSLKQLAEEFGVHFCTISKIKANKSWQQI
jgi:hypothetical protein